MSGITLKEVDESTIPTPATGKATVFMDEALGPAYKDDTGTVTALEGIPGQGVPAGGTAGQVLEKIDGTNYNTQWVDPSGGIPDAPSDGTTYGRKDGAWAAVASGGDVVGPASSVDSRVALFDGTTGKLLKQAGKTFNESRIQSIIVACSDETTNLTTGTAKVTFRMPYAFTLTGVRASLTAAQGSGSIFTVDINEGGATILSTKLTIDNTELTSTTAATPPVISDASLADDAEITIDIDQVGTAGAKGLKIYLIGYAT